MTRPLPAKPHLRRFVLALKVLSSLKKFLGLLMIHEENEEKLLRSVALQNAQAVFLARERAERELHESNERITNILESITDALIVLDRDWRLTYVNPQAEQILAPLKKTRSNLLGKTYWSEFPELVGSPLEKHFRSAVAEKLKVEFEIYYPPLSSWFEVRAYPARVDFLFTFWI
jgi:PAS domain-containing protein